MDGLSIIENKNMRFFLFSFVLVIVFATSLEAKAESTVLWKCNTAHCTTQEWSTSVQTACDNYKWAENARTFIRLENFWLNQWYCVYENDSSPGVEVQGYFTQDLTVNCTSPQTVDIATATCTDPPECAPPAVWDAQIGFCVTPPQCENTIGHTYSGYPGPAVAGPSSECVGGCSYDVNDFVFTSASTGYWLFIGSGSSCSGEPSPNPDLLPEPIPEIPIAETEPETPIVDDGDETPEQATDEGQEQMSKQLGGIQDQLQNLERGTGQQTSQGNLTNSLLTQIANEMIGTGSGDSGEGTSDQDGDGTDDSFSDGGCLSPPFCNGDVLKCAIANQAYLTRCNLQDETIDITEADVMAQTGTTQTLEQYFDETNPENIVAVDSYWSAPVETTGTCPPDYSVNTSLGTIAFSWSYVCDLGTTVRPVVLLSGYIIVALMFYGSLLREWG